MMIEEQIGWLIQIEGASLSYWKGPEYGGGRIWSVWTGDRAKAIRFARKEDAQQVARGLPIYDFAVVPAGD